MPEPGRRTTVASTLRRARRTHVRDGSTHPRAAHGGHRGHRAHAWEPGTAGAMKPTRGMTLPRHHEAGRWRHVRSHALSPHALSPHALPPHARLSVERDSALRCDQKRHRPVGCDHHRHCTRIQLTHIHRPTIHPVHWSSSAPTIIAHHTLVSTVAPMPAVPATPPSASPSTSAAAPHVGAVARGAPRMASSRVALVRHVPPRTHCRHGLTLSRRIFVVAHVVARVVARVIRRQHTAVAVNIAPIAPLTPPVLSPARRLWRCVGRRHKWNTGFRPSH